MRAGATILAGLIAGVLVAVGLLAAFVFVGPDPVGLRPTPAPTLVAPASASPSLVASPSAGASSSAAASVSAGASGSAGAGPSASDGASAAPGATGSGASLKP
jgi:hypothetical protein